MKAALRLTTLALLMQLGTAALAAPPVSGLDLKGFDAQSRPQDDLFRAANGHWLDRTEIPADKSSYGTFIQLRDQSDARVRLISYRRTSRPSRGPRGTSIVTRASTPR